MFKRKKLWTRSDRVGRVASVAPYVAERLESRLLLSFVAGQLVEATTTLRVRMSDSTLAAVLTNEATGNEGTIQSGPYPNQGFNWYDINWQDKSTGYSVDSGLEAAPPTVANVSPSPLVGSNSAQTLTITGGGFTAGSTVVLREPALSHSGAFTSSPISTTFISSTELQISAKLGNDAVTWTTQVTSSGGTSGQFSFPVNAPAPAITSLSPPSATAGGSSFTLTVNGVTFEQASKVEWNGTNLVTTPTIAGGLVTNLQAAVPAADVASAGTEQVIVVNPGPGGGISTSATFTVGAISPPQGVDPNNMGKGDWITSIPAAETNVGVSSGVFQPDALLFNTSRARRTFSMMSSAFAVHSKDCGFSLCASM